MILSGLTTHVSPVAKNVGPEFVGVAMTVEDGLNNILAGRVAVNDLCF